MTSYTNYDILPFEEVYQMNTLKDCRNRSGLSQNALADAISRPVSYIGKIECGMLNINNVTLENGYKIAKALNCRMEDLIDKDNLKD